ncbi:MAG: nitrogenase component I subunit alpha [Prevotella sp.]|jgi:nitrogenase molybdenum-iron protein alpha chain|nr:nitrogenase component I subunit alpha [Prevotella sp.]MCH3995215.1 nitrogenase component I subunit alpha [Prevotella sp.]MCI1246011.1 nitrogenase component I subunit alpha [Prevotella sp.]
MAELKNTERDVDTILEDMKSFRDEIITKYPPKVAKKRAKSMVINEDPNNPPEIQANVRTVPGIITQRGCTYAGCKGVVMGPTRDIVHIVHGPIGCSFYAWLTRRNETLPTSDSDPNFINYCFSTDMQEKNIVFGGEKKLKQAIREAYELFHPKTIAIYTTCPVGLIGDDVHRAAKQMMKELDNKVNIFGFSCEGYRGVSQSAGHHIANNGLFRNIIEKGDYEVKKDEKKYRINLMGEYNIGGDEFEMERIFKECGINLVATLSGNGTVEKYHKANTADLDLVVCHRSINYVAEMMETAYGIPWIKVDPLGATSTVKMLRKICKYFDDKELTDRVEKVIAEEMDKVEKVREEIYPKTRGKLAMLFVGGSRAHHYQALFDELGMKTISAGYEFAHRDDYEGRRVIPTIKIDADSRNIEEITVTKDEKKFHPRKTQEEIDQLSKEGVDLNDYKGMMHDMSKGTLVIDDISLYEMDKLIERYHPNVFCAGIKEKFCVQKLGIPLKQLHNYDSGGPYAGFKGAINFYRDIEAMVGASIWKEIKAPWEKKTYAQAQ